MIRRKRLIELCRQLSTLLDAGVPITRALKTIESSARGSAFRRVMSDVGAAVGTGESLESAFSRRAEYFPPLFLKLLAVGERTGTVDAVLRHMAEYFEGQDRLIKNTLSGLIYPAVQFTIAIFVIALAKYVKNMLVSDTADAKSPFPMLGGASAGMFLLEWFGTIALVVGGYFVLVKVLRGKRLVDEVLLRIPIIGHTLRTLAVARFCWAFQLCMKAGLGIKEGLQLSMDATGNAAFAATTPAVFEALDAGGVLRKSLEAANIFPRTMLEIVEVGETSGKIDQSMEKAAQQSFESAAFAMKTLAHAFTWLVWLLVVGLLVYYILSFYTSYIGLINSLSSS